MSVQPYRMPCIGYATKCPIVKPNNVLAFKSASYMYVPTNVSSQFSNCNPTTWSFLQVYTEDQVARCCTESVPLKTSTLQSLLDKQL